MVHAGELALGLCSRHDETVLRLTILRDQDEELSGNQNLGISSSTIHAHLSQLSNHTHEPTGTEWHNSEI